MAVLNENNIRSDFKATELVPYDLDKVLACLHVQLQTPSSVVMVEGALQGL